MAPRDVAGSGELLPGAELPGAELPERVSTAGEVTVVGPPGDGLTRVAVETIFGASSKRDKAWYIRSLISSTCAISSSMASSGASARISSSSLVSVCSLSSRLHFN